MTAYVIFTVDKIHDPEKLNAYKRAAHPTITEKGGKVSVAYGRTEVLEGELIEGVVMVEFEDFDTASTWYHGEAYKTAKALREGAVTVRSVIVESR